MDGCAGTHTASEDATCILLGCGHSTFVTNVSHVEIALYTTLRLTDGTSELGSRDRAGVVEHEVLDNCRRSHQAKQTYTTVFDTAVDVEVAELGIAVSSRC